MKGNNFMFDFADRLCNKLHKIVLNHQGLYIKLNRGWKLGKQ